MKQHTKTPTSPAYDLELLQSYQWVAGIDEVGRGSLAGPITAGMVVLTRDALAQLPPVADSKTLSSRVRQERVQQMLTVPHVFASRQADWIDRRGIQAANVAIFAELIGHLQGMGHGIVILDGGAVPIGTSLPCRFLPKAESISCAVAAASILAKESRDAWMLAQHETYPQYQWASNMGYGTAAHLSAIREHGLSPLHRRTFIPASCRR